MSEKKTEKLEAKIECPSCGGDANMSKTKNNTVFVYCRNPIGDDGEFCGYRGFLGRTKSREILGEIKIYEKENINVDTEDEQIQIEKPANSESATYDRSGADIPNDRAETFNQNPEAKHRIGTIFTSFFD